MAVLSLSNVSKHFAGFDILKNISFTIERDFKVGLIGKNGSGKTTLFKLIKGDISPDAGDIFIPKKIKVSFLHQEAIFDENQSLADYVVSGAKEYLNLKKELKNIEEIVSSDHSQVNIDRLELIQNKFDAIEGYEFEQKIKTILYSLKFPKEVWEQDLSLFSGGEKTRLQLAKTLIQPFDVLLLDEPTNHLDIGMIYWLENYLNSLEKPYIIISHDRYFLDKTVNRIFEIKNKTLKIFRGNFKTYQAESIRLQELTLKTYIAQQKKFKKEEDFIQRNMAGQKVKQAKSRLKQLDKMEMVERPNSAKSVNLKFDVVKRSGKKVFQFKNASFGFNNLLFSNFTELIKYQDKVAVLGKNGCGKSTLLKLLNDELKLTSGEIIHGSSISLGYYDQFHIELNEKLSVKETVWELKPDMTIGEVYSYLAKFEFYEQDWDKKVKLLSGGERARLFLAKLIFSKPNVLLLDEPTNHLDISMIDSLESALKNFNGTIIFVSHDRLFIENVANRYFLFDENKIMDIDRSLESIFNDNLANTNKKKGLKHIPKPIIKKKRTNPFLLKQLEEKISNEEQNIQNILDSINDLEMEFSKPENLSNSKFVIQLNLDLKYQRILLQTKQDELDKLEMEYLEMIED